MVGRLYSGYAYDGVLGLSGSTDLIFGKNSPFSSAIILINPEIGNSLYLTLPFLKKNGYFPPMVSIFCSKIVFLIDDTFGLNAILNYFSPSLKNISSKSIKIV
jgi:hypothetical protein